MAVEGRWLKNFRETELRGSPTGDDWLRKLGQFTWCRQEADQQGQRIQVFVAGGNGFPSMTGWVNAVDLGPVDAPDEFPPEQPGFDTPPGGGGPFLSNFRETNLMSQATGGQVIATAKQFSVFAQLAKQDGPRILTYYYGSRSVAGTPAWIEALDLGPVPQPEILPPVIDDGDPGLWTPELGGMIAGEDLWDPNGQPRRREAMEQFNALPFDRRAEIFNSAMDAALTAEGVLDGGDRASWTRAMSLVVRGGPFGSTSIIAENPDLNPFILAGESGGVFRGGAPKLNSAALGYFQFIATKPDGSDFGHWTQFMPDHDRSMMTNPTSQVQEFIRAVLGGRHHGDPFSVVDEKARTGVWGP